MKITSITRQLKDFNRFNISVDGVYLFSLDEFQLIELSVKKNFEYSKEQIDEFVEASKFGKVYARALEYCLMRPRSSREVKDYLYKKTKTTLNKSGNKQLGISKSMADAIFVRLFDKGYIDDKKFTIFWIENRFVKKGISQKRLKLELLAKGVEQSVVDELLKSNGRDDSLEIKKIIKKKQHQYDDEKLMRYLIRKGFNYDDIKRALGGD